MPIKALRIITGLFFVVLGILGILPSIEEGIFSLNNNNILLEQLFGIIELICGVILLAALFTHASRKTLYRAALVVFVFWVIRIVLANFIFSAPTLALASGAFWIWLLQLLAQIQIAISVWVLSKAYD
ncbi:MAG: hypothetical protein CMN76_16060 [Spirochaetaceae bacterium]|nr:hypothetical protein [Spirochaetaceae bacterium]|tara:strand:- start:27271 stop:27654 length:384 start_codon:yes stop_codon:yes gene_type:complete